MFPDEELKLELPFGPNFPTVPSVSANDARISLVGPKLSFYSLKPRPDVADYDYIEGLGTKIADYLPHTPVTAVGINFVFEADVTDGIPICPKEPQQGVHSVLGQIGRITEELHRYSLSVDNGVLNLSIRQPTEGNHSCDFNFHHSLKSLADFKELVAECPIAKHRAMAGQILEDLVGTVKHESERPYAN